MVPVCAAAAPVKQDKCTVTAIISTQRDYLLLVSHLLILHSGKVEPLLFATDMISAKGNMVGPIADLLMGEEPVSALITIALVQSAYGLKFVDAVNNLQTRGLIWR